AAFTRRVLRRHFPFCGKCGPRFQSGCRGRLQNRNAPFRHVLGGSVRQVERSIRTFLVSRDYHRTCWPGGNGQARRGGDGQDGAVRSFVINFYKSRAFDLGCSKTMTSSHDHTTLPMFCTAPNSATRLPLLIVDLERKLENSWLSVGRS